MGVLIHRALLHIARHVAFWCVGVPVAVLFAAYLVAIAAACTRELWKAWKNDSARRKRREKTDPPL